MSAFPPGWYQDPFGRADVRWWSGIEWTSHVARGGQPFDDAPVPSAAADPDTGVPSPSPGLERPAPSNRMLLAGIAVVVLVAAAIIVLVGRGDDDSGAGSTQDAPGVVPPASAADVAPSEATTPTDTPAPGCIGNVYVTTDDGALVVIDTASNAVVDTIPVGGDARGLAVTPSGSKAYVANHEASTVTAVDLATGSTVATIELTTPTEFDEINESYEPVAVAVTPDGTTAYVVSYYGSTTFRGGLWVIDTANDAVVSQVDLDGRPQDVAVSSDGATAYVTAPEQAVFVIDTATASVAGTITLDGRPDGIALSPDGATAYVVDRVGSSMWVIDTATRTVSTTVAVDEYPVGVAVTPDGSTLYVSTEYGESVVVIDAATDTVTTTIDIDEELSYLEVAPNGSWVYAAGFDAVWVIDVATNTLSQPIDVGGWPRGIAGCAAAT